MKKFVIQLFSNRFGIVLATINLCYMASRIGDFSHELLDPLFACANAPAFIMALLSVGLVKVFCYQLSPDLTTSLISAFLSFFIVIQWLSIASFARAVAAEFRPKEF